MNAFFDFLHAVLGPDGQPKELTLVQTSIRGLIIFIIALILVRVGDRRSLSEKTGFDAVFILLLASILARAINGSGPFFVSIGASIVLMIAHRLCAFAACHSHAFGILIKGRNIILVRDGRIDRKAMNRKLVTQHDLEEDMRLDAQVEDLSKIRVARLERSGDISFIEKEQD